MRKFLALLLTTFLFIAVSAQVKSGDADLDKRMNDYLAYNKEMKIDQLMEYIHPSLFTIAPKEMIAKSLKDAFNSEELKMSFDSMSITAITNPFKTNDAEYRMVNYYSRLIMSFVDTTIFDQEGFKDIMFTSLQAAFPGKKIDISSEAKKIFIAGEDFMFAIKDKDNKDWMFLGYQANQKEMIKTLLPEEMRKHFKLED